MPTPGNQPIRVREPDDSPTRKWLEDRQDRALTGSLAEQARAEWATLRSILAAELARQEWTLGELGMLAEIIGEPLLDMAVSTGAAGLLQTELYDGTRGDETTWAEKWGVHPDAVNRRLNGLGPAAEHALRDAISRWWAAVDDRGDQHTPAGWARVGVRVVDHDSDRGRL